MLAGAYSMSVDAKGRVTLPSKYRKELLGEDDHTVMLVPYDGCLNCFTVEGFKVWLNGLFKTNENGFNARDRKDAQLKRFLLGTSQEVEIDSAGRVALGKVDQPTYKITEKLGLAGNVTVVGADDHLEVWNTDKWNEMRAVYEEGFDSLLYCD